MKLLKLKIENFKGIESLEINPNGASLNIYGANGSGKTTVFDAFTWVLFGKDSEDRSSFNIKPTDEFGKVVDNQAETIVTAVVEHDGETIELKKTYIEKWIKKHGTSTKVFSGNVTLNEINEIPVKSREYEDRVVNLCGKGIFKLLANPLYFNQIDWQERRKILIEICDKVSDNEIIAQFEELKPLMLIKNYKSVDQLKVVETNRRKKLAEELDDLNIRLSEAKNSVEVPTANKEDITKELNNITKELLQTEKDLRDLDNGEAKRKLENNLASKQNKYDSLELDRKQSNPVLEKINKLNKEVLKQQQEINGQKINLAELYNKKVIIQQKLQGLAKEYKEIMSRAWVGDGICTTCKQTLPIESIETAKAEFNKNKSISQEKNINSGNELSASLSDLAVEIAEKKDNIALLTKIHTASMDKISELEQQKDYVLEPSVEMNTIYSEIESIKNKIISMDNDIDSHKQSELSEKQAKLVENQQEQNNLLAMFSQEEKSRNRVITLENKIKETTIELEKTEQITYLCNVFNEKKIQLIQTQLKSKFKHAQFNMFRTTQEGELVEICETAYKGIAFTDLNTASTINIGLDIIKTLSEHYNFTAPIFIDNAESITNLWEIESQLVRLIVSADDEKLRVEETVIEKIMV